MMYGLDFNIVQNLVNVDLKFPYKSSTWHIELVGAKFKSRPTSECILSNVIDHKTIKCEFVLDVVSW